MDNFHYDPIHLKKIKSTRRTVDVDLILTSNILQSHSESTDRYHINLHKNNSRVTMMHENIFFFIRECFSPLKESREESDVCLTFHPLTVLRLENVINYV